MSRLLSHVAVLAATAVFVALWLCVPMTAECLTYTEGTPKRPFTLTDTGGLIVVTDESGDPYLTPPYEAATTFDGTSIEFEPRSVREASDGSLLVACGKHGYILRIGTDGRTRKYTKNEIPGLARPFDAYPLEDDGMLIVDRAEQGFGRVFKVDANLQTTWEFGGASGMGAGQVFDPFTAEPLAGGHTLIADSLGYRVIEVDEAGAVVWSYGTFRVEGPGPGLLIRPHSAQRLANNNTLICDAAGNRVIEVSYEEKKIVWSYGTGVAGIGKGQLSDPNSAVRLPNGNTLICDSMNGRVIEVTSAGRIAQAFGGAGRTPTGGRLVDPRAAMRRADGSTAIADLGNRRIARYRYRPNREYTATSAKIDLSVGVVKAFSKIRAAASVPAGASVALEYQIDNGAWMDVPRHGSLSSDAIGSTIHYRLRVATSGFGAAPTIGDVAVTWAKASTATASKPKPKGGSASHSGSTAHSQSASTSAAPATSTPDNATHVGKVDVLVPGFVAPGAVQGGLAAATMQSTTMSGWVMREAESADAGFGRNAGSDAKQARIMSRQAAPSMALLLVVYSMGLIWSPASRLLRQAIRPVMQH